MASLRYAQVFLRCADPAEVEAALAGVLARDGYEPFDASLIPPGYPAEAGEFDRFLLAGPDAAGTVTLILEDTRRAFARAGELAARMPGALLVALVRPAAEPLRLKAYRDGVLCLKVGDDPDDELFYNPIPSEASAVTAFLHAWSGPAAAPPGLAPGSIARHLGLARLEVTFADARGGAWPAPVTLRTFASRRSRLYRES